MDAPTPDPIPFKPRFGRKTKIALSLLLLLGAAGAASPFIAKKIILQRLEEAASLMRSELLDDQKSQEEAARFSKACLNLSSQQMSSSITKSAKAGKGKETKASADALKKANAERFEQARLFQARCVFDVIAQDQNLSLQKAKLLLSAAREKTRIESQKNKTITESQMADIDLAKEKALSAVDRDYERYSLFHSKSKSAFEGPLATICFFFFPEAKSSALIFSALPDPEKRKSAGLLFAQAAIDRAKNPWD